MLIYRRLFARLAHYQVYIDAAGRERCTRPEYQDVVGGPGHERLVIRIYDVHYSAPFATQDILHYFAGFYDIKIFIDASHQ